jgi:hypothetical protein
MGATAASLEPANPDFQGKLGTGLMDAQSALMALSAGQPTTSLELIDDECSPPSPGGGGGDNDDDD